VSASSRWRHRSPQLRQGVWPWMEHPKTQGRDRAQCHVHGGLQYKSMHDCCPRLQMFVAGLFAGSWGSHHLPDGISAVTFSTEKQQSELGRCVAPRSYMHGGVTARWCVRRVSIQNTQTKHHLPRNRADLQPCVCRGWSHPIHCSHICHCRDVLQACVDVAHMSS
jgi:hypothetical protein